MTSRILYLSILGAAVFVAILSFLSIDGNHMVSFFTLNRYELFGLFIYFSIVYPIYATINSQSTETENISLDSLKFMSFSIHPKLVILLLTVFVLFCVFITA